MTIDAAPLAALVADFMDRLEAEYGADARLVDALVAVEIDARDDNDDRVSIVRWNSIDGRAVVEHGIASRVLRGSG